MITRKLQKKYLKPAILLLLFAVVLTVGLIFRPNVPTFNLLAMAITVLLAENVLTIFLQFLSPKSHRGKTLVTIFISILKYVAAIVILCWGLNIIGVDVATIVTSMGILALIVGFGAESLIADVVTGVFMLFENQYNVGDIVEVDGFRGTVCDIGIRTTSIVDIVGNVKIVNNSDMKSVLNRSDNLSVSNCDIAIPYETDLERLEEQLPELMEAIYERHRDVMRKAPEYLGVQELADSSVVLRFVAYVSDADFYATRRIMNRELLLGFRRLGVECPFPQLDIHTK